MPPASPTPPFELLVEAEDEGVRLDVWLADKLSRYSRVQLRRAISAGGVKIDGHSTKVAYRLRPGQRVTIELPQQPRESPEPEEVPLEILFEDDALAVVNKPSGMVVHPSKGHWSGTLTAALAWHFENLSSCGGSARPGIVHRLDRDTSGVIVVAKTDEAHLALAAQFEARTVEKEYFALVKGTPDRDHDVVEQPIGAHPHQREKMAIRADHATSRDARTLFETAERFTGFAAVRAFPKTGRTHQIRIHLAHLGYPVLCDKLYGGRSRITEGELREGREGGAVVLERQALHARRLRLTHPQSGEPLECVAPLPADIQHALDCLRQWRAKK
ncbi:MAG: RluA family pseudouridine synthase [Pirellulaceae bacterium]